MKKTKFLFARCLTLLVLALMSTNLAWGEEKSFEINITNFTEITTNYNTTYTHNYEVDGSTVSVEAKGVYKNSNGIQMNSGKGTYIKNTAPIPGYITKIVVTWSATGKNSPTLYVNKGKVASTSSTSLGKGSNTVAEQTYSVSNPSTSQMDYFYFDGTTVTGACYAAIKVYYEPVTAKTLESIAVKTAPTKTTYNVGETFDPAGLVITATYDTGDPEDIAYAGNEDKFSFSPALDAALATTDENVTITYGEKSVDQEITVNLIKLATPTNLAATPTSTSATLTWGEVANASSYEVKLNGETKTAETNSLLVEELTPSTAYTWTVKAIGDKTTYSDSEVSAENNFTTLAPPSVAYTVTFSGNGHGTPISGSITEAGAGAGITLPGCTPNDGYQFVGWATTETATEAEYEAGATYYPIENITLHAVYNEVYTITWSINGTSTTEGNPTTSVVKGDGITALPTAPASISGMSFQGWTATQIAESSATKPTDLFTDAEHAPAITANTTFYAVFAEESEGDVTWNKVTTLAGITEGQYVIINGGYYLPNTKSTSTGPTAVEAPTISNNIIADANVTATMKWSFTSTGTTNQFYVKNSNDDYLYATSANNGVRVSNTSDKWTFAENTSGYFSMKDANNSRYCAKYKDDKDWRSYTSATHENYVNGGKLELYKKTQDITYTYYTNVVVKQLTSITLSGEYPKEFWKGETFSHEGMTVTAHYDDESTKDVTSSATFTGYDKTTAGEQEVTVTYDTKEAKYNITVKSIVNTKETAYTVTEAKAIIDANPSELATTNVYVKGTVSKIVTAWDSQYGNITFDVSADGQTTDDQFQFYRNFKDAENTQWASAAECPTVGDDVIGYGTMKKHSSTYEFDAGNYLVSHVKATTFSIDNITVSFGGEIEPVIKSNVPEAERTISYSVASEDVVKVDEEGKLVTVAVGGPVAVTATLTAEGYKSAETTFTVEVIKALESIAVKTAPTTVKYKEGDFFNPAGLVITATYNEGDPEDITYSEETKESFTFEPSLETALTTENNSVTITYAGKTTTQEITVRALNTYDITWMANGEQFTTTQVTEGDVLALPETNPEAIDDFVFKGWIATKNYYDAETAPTYIVPAEIKPEGVMTFYAVFAKEVEVERPKTYSLLPTDFETGSYSANDGDKEINGVTLSIKDVYKNTYIQMAKNTGSLFNKYALGTKITSVVVSVQTNSVKVYEGSTNESWTEVTGSNGTYTFSDDKAYFKVTSTSSYAQVNSITVNYIGKTTSYSNYRTTIAPRTFTKTISNRKMATLYLDYAVTIPEKVNAYTAADKGDHTAITLEKITDGVIPANTGVIIYSDIATDYTFTETTDAGSTYENNCLKGVTEKTVYNEVADYDADTYNYYALMADGETSVVFKLVSGGSYAANSAYLVLPKTNAAKVEFTFGDEVTGIESLQPSTLNPQPSQYNLNGVRVNNGYKGIVIMNGKKYINK